MKIMLTGREISVKKIVNVIGRLLKILLNLAIVRSPFKMLKHYIIQTSPKIIVLRNGFRINMSSHPHDLMTFFGVFLRKDYGFIKPGSIVIDIGANIGIFSLYTVQSGAKKVYAFEPSKEAFEILVSNIKSNNLIEKIIPINKAVSDQDNLKILFPMVSSPYNMINGIINDQLEYCEIYTITLSKFITELDIERVDLLKLDCEGAEFVILPSLNQNSLSRINDIRMEYHGDPTSLVTHLNQNNYDILLNEGVAILKASRKVL